MSEKVLLLLVSGLHPSGMEEAVHPFIKELKSNSTYTLNGRTVYPSLSLPACLSMCQSIPPEKHGVLTETYRIPSKPVQGLVERAFKSGKSTAFYYSKFFLRDIVRGGHLMNSICLSVDANGDCGQKLTELAINYIEEEKPDLFLVQYSDLENAGKEYGWGSSMFYKFYARKQMEYIEKLYRKYKDEYTFVVVSDHAGHKFKYGTELPEDVTVPMFFCGPLFEKGKEIETCSLLDIAPTVAKIMGFSAVKEWEGKSIL